MNTAAPLKRILFASPWWHAGIVNGVLRHAAKRGWHVDLQTCLSGVLPERWEGDGVVTQMGRHDAGLLRILQSCPCPCVSLNNNYPQNQIPRVSTNSAMAGTLAADHLLERGFRSFAFFAGRALPTQGMNRCIAFEKRLKEHGFTAERIIANIPSSRQQAYSEQAFDWLRERLLALPRPLGVFAFNDQDAVAVIEACMVEGVSIPHEVAVLGVLNMEIFRQSTTIELSSIDFDFDAMTGKACEVLAGMMEGEPAPPEPIFFPPTGVITRESTDTLAAHKPRVAKAIRFMLESYDRDISMDDVLTAVGGSRAGLFKAFKQDMGQSPGEVLARIRVDKAKRMLEDTDERIYAVSEACGFGEPINLHRVFKQHTGMSPNAYRKAKRVAD